MFLLNCCFIFCCPSTVWCFWYLYWVIPWQWWIEETTRLILTLVSFHEVVDEDNATFWMFLRVSHIANCFCGMFHRIWHIQNVLVCLVSSASQHQTLSLSNTCTLKRVKWVRKITYFLVRDFSSNLSTQISNSSTTKTTPRTLSIRSSVMASFLLFRASWDTTWKTSVAFPARDDHGFCWSMPTDTMMRFVSFANFQGDAFFPFCSIRLSELFVMFTRNSV